MPRCYLAGPMRSKPKFNYPAFMEGQRRLEEAGWEVFNPANIDINEDHGGNLDSNDPFLRMTIEEQEKHAGHPGNARRYARRDCRILIEELRAESGDAIVVLPDWQESVGAVAEVGVATWVGLPVRTLEEACQIRT